MLVKFNISPRWFWIKERVRSSQRSHSKKDGADGYGIYRCHSSTYSQYLTFVSYSSYRVIISQSRSLESCKPFCFDWLDRLNMQHANRKKAQIKHLISMAQQLWPFCLVQSSYHLMRQPGTRPLFHAASERDLLFNTMNSDRSASPAPLLPNPPI